MKIKMLSTRKWAPDGWNMKIFEKDKIYEVSHSTGCFFVFSKWAERLDAKEA